METSIFNNSDLQFAELRHIFESRGFVKTRPSFEGISFQLSRLCDIPLCQLND